MINFFSKYKFIFYLSNIILLVLYLFPGSLLGCYLYNDCQLQPQLTKDFLVSTNHLYAFSLLSIIGFFTFNDSKKLNFLNIYLILLSIILEIFKIVFDLFVYQPIKSTLSLNRVLTASLFPVSFLYCSQVRLTA